jgi:hypothetical protein
MRYVTTALLWTVRPGWLKVAIMFSGIHRGESDNVV